MNPTAAGIESGIDRCHKSSAPPTHAKGTLSRIISAGPIRRKVHTSTARMPARVTGITTARRLRASASDSYCPPHA